MSLVFNMVGGGGGKLKNTDAVLVVTVLTGSTVTATKSGTTLTPTMWTKATDQTLECAIFSIPSSQFDNTTPWMITATLGTNTASGTVLITTNKEYEITLAYELWIHKVGDGLSSGLSVSWTSGKSGTVNENEISCNYSDSFCCMVITPSIDLTNYSTLHFEYIKTAAGAGAPGSEGKTGYFGFASNTTTGPYSADIGFVYSTKPAVSSNWSSATVDISAAQSSYYFKFCCWNNGYMGVRNVYLQ